MNEILRESARMFAPADRARIAVLVLLMLVGAWAETFSIGLVIPFIGMLNDPALIHKNAVLSRLYQAAGAQSEAKFMILATGAFLGMFLAKNMLLGALHYAQARFVYAKEATLSNALLERYLSAPYSLHLDRNSAELIRLLTTDVPRVTNGFLQPMLVLISELLVILMIAALLIYVQPLVTLVVAGVMIVGGAILSRFFRARLASHQSAVRRLGIAAQTWAAQALGALKEVRVFDAKPHFVSRYRESVQGYVRGYQAFAFLNQTPRLVVETFAVTILLAFVAVSLARTAEMREFVPLLAVFALSATRIMPSLTRIISAVNSLRFSMPFVRAVWRDLAIEVASEPPRQPGEPRASADGGAILDLLHVSYRHPGMERWILEDVSLSVRRGESVAIVGYSGAGKSTLADLMLGLIVPSRGTVAAALHGQVGYVPQHPYLLDDSVRRNVAFGVPDERIDDVRVWQALELARLADQVRRLDRGLDTRIGERGVKLSGGERQRLSIARALYFEPQIVIFDEATSSLDPRTEREITDTIGSLAGRTTLVIVTHRIAAAARCDRIAFLAKGRIEALGRYDELVASSAAFQRMIGSDSPNEGA